jgi:hypothetical protein
VRHLFERPSIGGLVSGQTYVVVGSGSNFSLANTATPSTVIVLDKSERSGLHTIGLAGLDLQASSGTHELHIDLTGSLPGGSHELLGVGGTVAAPARTATRRRPVALDGRLRLRRRRGGQPAARDPDDQQRRAGVDRRDAGRRSRPAFAWRRSRSAAEKGTSPPSAAASSRRWTTRSASI